MKTIVEITPGPSTPIEFEAQIPQPSVPTPSQLPPIGLVEIETTFPANTPAEILAKLLTVDGAGSGLDADFLDGQHGTFYLDRANHTGSQSIDTVSGLQAALDGKVSLTDYEDADVLLKIKNVDGTGSGLDADLLDG